ncbi:hypothetical protein FHS39_001580 [Streptomyces olivoverticillatus]|uniref:Mycothiol-dependent maleylpyruvate isomerase metal-binding domain-containing protein n=1 Tax=Streptomyces olivoverticillatus TaxID=66427 RepID=A0A7W7LLN3_9ACTN|nr:maleylpyruvate isomerase N-terminal domain-containing protein [Streptomyces olivoverticillatus]MBB4892569.1 hypothetical protein [Streptomyces olivoverticillatus]
MSETQSSARTPRTPVTADDLEEVVRLAVAAFRGAPEDRWGKPAGSLEWDCWETVEHLADDMFCYALQLAPPAPPQTGYLPTVLSELRPGGPKETIHVERGDGPDGLIQVLEGCTGLLAAVVRTKPPRTRGYHTFGLADPEGFAAMGIVEALVHAHDIAQGLGVAWEPPADLCGRTLARLFPDVPADGDPYRALLRATGRLESDGAPWRWHSAPLD